MEWLIFLTAFTVFFEFTSPMRDRPALQLGPEGPFPFVHIFICCCKEEVDVIHDTVIGSMHMVYPHDRYSVWVLDDGGDDELKEIVELEASKYGHDRLSYIRREKKKGVPHHAKAGNINHGLSLATGEFMAVLDADMIPSPHFLSSLMPHFTSERIGFVQCPQSFYNVLKGDPLNDQSRDFYDVVLPYRDARNSAPCVGTGVIYRISALRDVGGVTQGTVTEDFDTAMSLHAGGYDTVYVNQKLQAGLAPWTLEAYLKQHARWCVGALQLMRDRVPHRSKSTGFDLYRRIFYSFHGMNYYQYFNTMALCLLPLFILGFDIPVLPKNSPPSAIRLYLTLLLPYGLMSRLVFCFLTARYSDGDRIQMRGEQAWFWNGYYYTIVCIKFWFPWITTQFNATGSMPVEEKGLLRRLSVVWFHLLFIAAALSVCIWQLAVLDYHNCGQLMKVLGWTPGILFTAQSFLVPVLHVLNSPWHPKPEERRRFLKYTEDGVPFYTHDMVSVQKDWRLNFYHIIPVVWLSLLLVFFVFALTDYNPSFCTDGGFFSNPTF